MLFLDLGDLCNDIFILSRMKFNLLTLHIHHELLNGYQPETKLKGGKAMRTFSQIK